MGVYVSFRLKRGFVDGFSFRYGLTYSYGGREEVPDGGTEVPEVPEWAPAGFPRYDRKYGTVSQWLSQAEFYRDRRPLFSV